MYLTGPRLIQVRWSKQAVSGYRVNLLIRAYNRRELIKDISSQPCKQPLIFSPEPFVLGCILIVSK